MRGARSSVRRSDVVITALLVVLACFTIFVVTDRAGDEINPELPLWGNYLMAVVLIGPLAVRRRFPLAVGLWVGFVFTAYRVLKVPEDAVSSATVFLALFSVGAYSYDARRRRLVQITISATALAALLWALFRNLDVVSFDGATIAFISISVNFGFFAAAWVLGEIWRQRQESATALEERAEQLAEEREQRARQAVVEERVRISRELHDVVAHHVSVMGVQAAGARAVLDTDPSRAREALEAVEESGRQAVSELQRLVGFLRESDEDQAAAPQPTLDDVATLIENTRSAGVPIEVRTIGRSRAVPSSVALSAYRIIQEALTNVMKYAAGAATTVVLTYSDSALGVEIVNQPPSVRRDVPPGGGRGMVGMRERAAMLGGTLTAGAAAGGGYRVAAELPTGTSFRSSS